MASGNTDPAVIAKAEALLKSSDEKLAASTTLKATYTETDEYPGEYRDLRQTGTIAFAHPNQYRLAIVRARRVNPTDPWKNSGNDTLAISDGKNAYSVFFHPNSTQVRAIETPNPPKVEEAPLLSGFFGGVNSPAAALEKVQADGTLDSVDVQGSTVQIRTESGSRTIEMGNDGLVHRLVVRNDKTHATRTWVLDSISLDAKLPSKTFEYVSPKDALPYPTAQRSNGIATGSEGPNFTVYSPQNQSVQLSDLKGKVVVLEFWATWCWPCNQSIPETQRILRSYRDKGVDGLLVSIKDSRKGFDAWIKKHPQYSDLKFGFDDPVNGQAYEAFAHPNNPTLYIIGRDGRVVAKFEGYTGPNPAVEKAIQSAL
jgi:peroxiredoxin/outer membrane lipoprotein-sorting protein